MLSTLALVLNPAPRSTCTYREELQVLGDIVSASASCSDGSSFLSVFQAYDSVLKSRDIDPAKDRVFFKFLLKLARVEGETWLDKFESLLGVSFGKVISV